MVWPAKTKGWLLGVTNELGRMLIDREEEPKGLQRKASKKQRGIVNVPI